MRDQKFWVKEAQKKSARRKFDLCRAARMGQATQASYMEEMERIKWSMLSLEEEDNK